MGRKFLIIDDSALMRRVISDIISSNSEYEVLDLACNGEEGLSKITKHPGYYDLILLDINMPKMNGLEMLEAVNKKQMKETIVVVSTVAKEGAKETLKALELGALDFLTKPENFYEVKGEDFRDSMVNLIETVCGKDYNRQRIATRAKSGGMLEKKSSQNSTSRTAYVPAIPVMNETSKKDVDKACVGAKGLKAGMNKLVALACSTGGPKSLQYVIPYIPANLDAPVVIVQHMPKGFTESLASRLNGLGEITVQEAKDGDALEKGNAYIAPGGMHIAIEKRAGKHYIKFDDAPPVDGLKPCANIMYKSLVKSTYDEITCVVMTGMGADGTLGIGELKKAGCNIHVIGQEKESCVVYGMPRALAEAGLADEVVPLNKITETIIKNVGVM